MNTISAVPPSLAAYVQNGRQQVEQPVQTPVEQPVQTPVEPPAQQPGGNNPGVIVEITPGADNVTSGDRSQNTAQITVTTPNNTYSGEVSRAQVVQRSAQKMQMEALGADGGGDAVRNAALLQNGALGNDTVAATVNGKMQQNMMDTYANAAQKSSGDNGQEEQSTAQKYQQASNAYIKQELFFDKVEDSAFSSQA